MAGTCSDLVCRAALLIVCGLPGSGKTTVATRLADERGAVRMCADDWMERLGISLWDSDARARVEHLQWRMGQDLLAAGCSVVVEWGTWGRSERTALREAARQRGASVELHFLDAPDEELWRRISARGKEQPPITLDDVRTWREFFEPPTEAELALYDVARRQGVRSPARPAPRSSRR